MLGIDRITHLQSAGLEVCGGKLSERFAGRPEVGSPVVRPPGSENGAGLDVPFFVGLDQNEAFVGWDRGDPADELGGCGSGFFLGVFFLLVLEKPTGGEGEAGQNQNDGGFHEISLTSPVPDWNPGFSNFREAGGEGWVESLLHQECRRSNC